MARGDAKARRGVDQEGKSDMTTRCKFTLDTITRRRSQRRKPGSAGEWEDCEMWSLSLSPVYGGNDPAHENAKFWEASPSGEFRLDVVNVDAVKHMEIGREYYIDITPAD